MADPATAIIGGASLMGGLAGSQSQGGGTSTATSEPWATQQPFLTYGFEQAKTAAGNALANPVFQGQRVAGLTPLQQQTLQAGGQFATGQFNPAQQLTNLSMGALSPTAAFGQNAADIYGSVAGVDPTQQILSNAALYADNPYTQGIIDASSRDVTRNLLEQQLPSMALGATGTGNINSTRTGVQQAIAERGAADRLADISSGIRGQFFNTGLSQAQNQYNQNLQNQLAANQALGQGFGIGASGLGQGQQLGIGAANLGTTLGGMEQSQQQAQINAQMQQFAEERDIPLDILQRYMQTVGGNYGSTQTQTAPETGGGFGGFMQGALGGGLGGAGLAGQFGGFGGLGQGAGFDSGNRATAFPISGGAAIPARRI